MLRMPQGNVLQSAAPSMSLGNREGEADDDAEPEDLPSLVRRDMRPMGVFPLHPAMDRTAGFFRVRKAPSAEGGAFSAACNEGTEMCCMFREEMK